MKEDFLQFIWRFQRFDMENLSGQKKEKISVLEAGFPNELNGGPDFSDSKVLINDILWYGHVEIHINASDWYKHKHEQDPAYNNVILHVVLNHDCDVETQQGRKIPTLVLKSRIPGEIRSIYQNLLHESKKIPCRAHLQKIKQSSFSHWFDRVAHQRLERKSQDVISILIQEKGDWESTVIKMCAKYLGFKVNAESFSMLSEHISWQWIQRNYKTNDYIEAYLFGMAGYLTEEGEDEYTQKLRDIYNRISKQYKLSTLPVHIWKYSRMRPANFPSLRISELAALFTKHGRLWASLKRCKNLNALRSYLDVEYSSYWQNHYDFNKISEITRNGPGKMSQDLILINVVSPLLYAYGKTAGKSEYQELAMDIWQDLPPENNRIIKLWKQEGLHPRSAWDTQALLELKSEFCNHKRCMDCHIGKSILMELSEKYMKSERNKTPISVN